MWSLCGLEGRKPGIYTMKQADNFIDNPGCCQISLSLFSLHSQVVPGFSKHSADLQLLPEVQSTRVQGICEQ